MAASQSAIDQGAIEECFGLNNDGRRGISAPSIFCGIVLCRWSTNDGGHDFARAAVVAELAEVNALPCSEIEPSVGDGYGERRSGNNGFGMGRHVVGPFKGVEVVGRTFRHKFVEYGVEVLPHVGVGVFVQRQGRRGVLYQQVQESGLRQ